jgi:hypothetical protein
MRPVAAGHLELRLTVPASRSARRVELHWTSTIRLPEPDNRPVSAQLLFLGIVRSGSTASIAPIALRHFPEDLARPGLSYSGIYLDGWIRRQAFVVLTGGRAADLTLRAEVPSLPGGQRLRLFVNGRQIAARRVAAGRLEWRVAVPASGSPRRVEFRWARAARIGANDPRQAAALLRFVGLVSPGSS